MNATNRTSSRWDQIVTLVGALMPLIGAIGAM